MIESSALTDAAVERYKPAEQRRRIRDTKAESLFLIVEASGYKSWQMRFRRPNGKPAKLALGPYDSSGKELDREPEIGQPLTLAAARQLATIIHRQRALGEDVIADHRARKHRQRAQADDKAANSFGIRAVEFFRDHTVKKWQTRPRRWRENARLLGLRWASGADPEKTDPEVIKGGLAERWAETALPDIDEADILYVVDDVRKNGVPGLERHNTDASQARGRKVHAALSSFFQWAKNKRLVMRNPCRDVSHPGAPPARDRVLTTDEIRWFWNASVAIDEDMKLFGPVLRLLLLTGSRLREVGEMRRRELCETMWTIPGARAKNHLEHSVPLAPLAREQIRSGNSDFVFTTTGGETPVSGWSSVKRRVDAAMLDLAREERGADCTIPPWRLHDLRRTLVTGMGELGIRPDVIELVVNHISGSRAGVAGVYNKAELMPERRQALECWARFVSLIIDGDLYAAHEKSLARGDEKARNRARQIFKAAVTEGGDRWDRYLKMLTAGAGAKIVALHAGG